MKVDLVLFIPDVVIDRATFEHPKRLSLGIHIVFVVNGLPVRSSYLQPFRGVTDWLQNGRRAGDRTPSLAIQLIKSFL